MSGVRPEFPTAAGADASALNKVFDSLYRELHSMAHQQLRRNGSDALDTTVLVHELYLRLAKADEVPISDPRHFLALASNAMRFVIVDIIRVRNADKRGAGLAPLTLDTRLANSISTSADEIVRVHEALLELATIDAMLVQVVELRYFAGLTEDEIAEAMQMSTRTVRRHWQKAVIYLRANLA